MPPAADPEFHFVISPYSNQLSVEHRKASHPLSRLQLVHRGLVDAACGHAQAHHASAARGRTYLEEHMKEQRRVVSFRASGVYATFLAAWVGAQRQLQQDVVAAVVPAVMMAQQQEGMQEQQGR
jgi:hypothetical protein